MADLDVGVIYTYERSYMRALLESMPAAAGRAAVRLILIDNASRDGVEEWTSAMPDTLVLRKSERRTYAENLNLVLAASSAPFVLLMNTDMWFEPSEPCLEKMVRFMREHPRCGIAGCRLLHADGTEAYAARRYQTPTTFLGRRTPLAPLMNTMTDRYLYRENDPQDVFECDWLSGCFLLVRRDAYLGVGGLDQRFRKYFEDVDYCRRIAAAGWEVKYNGMTYCFHLEQRASGRLLSSDAAAHAKSYLRFVRKWGFAGHSKNTRRAA